jgi:hypothetical protein
MAHGILLCLGAFASVALAQSPGTGYRIEANCVRRVWAPQEFLIKQAL